MNRYLFTVVSTALVIGFSASTASAHAHLDHAEPKVGSTVQEAPAIIKIWFSEGVEPDLSKIEIKDASGKSVGKDDTKVDPANNKLLTVSVNPLVSGTYTVTWNVVADDTHKTHGSFSFTLKPAR